MAIRIQNDGFSQDRIKRGFTNAQGFPVNEFTILMNWYHDTLPTSQYMTYFILAGGTFAGADEYTVAFIPQQTTLGHQRFGIGSQGNDTYHASLAPTTGRWYRMMFRFYPTTGGNYNQQFYFDLPDASKVVERSRTAGLSGFTASHECAFGAPPYTTNEGVDGRIQHCLVFSGSLSISQGIRQLNQFDILPELRSRVWAHYKFRHHGDTKDWSGRGRHLTKVETSFTMSSIAGPVARPHGMDTQYGLYDVSNVTATSPTTYFLLEDGSFVLLEDSISKLGLEGDVSTSSRGSLLLLVGVS